MLTVNSEIEKLSKWSQSEFDLELAVLLVSKGKISSRKAVSLLQNISYETFLTELSRREIYIYDWQAQELLNDKNISRKNQ